jgi:hypothetical protein
MVEGRLKPIENIAVNSSRLAYYLEFRLLAKLSRDIPNKARKSADSIGQRPHPAGEYLMM